VVRVSGNCGGRDMHRGFQRGTLKERGELGDLSVDGRVMWKRIPN